MYVNDDLHVGSFVGWAYIHWWRLLFLAAPTFSGGAYFHQHALIFPTRSLVYKCREPKFSSIRKKWVEYAQSTYTLQDVSRHIRTQNSACPKLYPGTYRLQDNLGPRFDISLWVSIRSWARTTRAWRVEYRRGIHKSRLPWCRGRQWRRIDPWHWPPPSIH